MHSVQDQWELIAEGARARGLPLEARRLHHFGCCSSWVPKLSTCLANNNHHASNGKVNSAPSGLLPHSTMAPLKLCTSFLETGNRGAF